MSFGVCWPEASTGMDQPPAQAARLRRIRAAGQLVTKACKATPRGVPDAAGQAAAGIVTVRRARHYLAKMQW
jgi:hypothetical protein